MKIKLPICYVLMSILFFSCSTMLRIEPQTCKQSLVIGQIRLEAKNFSKVGSISVNGIHHSSINIRVLNLTTGEEFEVLSRGGTGLFYFLSEEGNTYSIVNFKYTNTGTHGTYAQISVSPTDLILQIEPGKVYNIGKIEWNADKDAHAHYFTFKRNYLELENLIRIKYAKSKWNLHEWENVVFSKFYFEG